MAVKIIIAPNGRMYLDTNQGIRFLGVPRIELAGGWHPIRQNVQFGHTDESGVFHPWRASSDYDPARVRESGQGKRTTRSHYLPFKQFAKQKIKEIFGEGIESKIKRRKKKSTAVKVPRGFDPDRHTLVDLAAQIQSRGEKLNLRGPYEGEFQQSFEGLKGRNFFAGKKGKITPDLFQQYAVEAGFTQYRDSQPEDLISALAADLKAREQKKESRRVRPLQRTSHEPKPEEETSYHAAQPTIKKSQLKPGDKIVSDKGTFTVISSPRRGRFQLVNGESIEVDKDSPLKTTLGADVVFPVRASEFKYDEMSVSDLRKEIERLKKATFLADRDNEAQLFEKQTNEAVAALSARGNPGPKTRKRRYLYAKG